MNKILRRSIVLVCAAITCVGSLIWSWLIGDGIAVLLRSSVRHGEPGTNVTPSTFSVFYQLSFVGVCLATAASTVMFFWESRPTKRSKIAICFLALLILVPVSAVNFHYGDFLMKAWVQAILDLVSVAIGLTAVLLIWDVAVTSVFLRVVKAIVVLLVLLESVVLPGSYAILWLLWWQGVPIKGATDQLVTGSAAIISAVIAIVNFTRKRGGQPASNSSILAG
jgi:hypothetical protein